MIGNSEAAPRVVIRDQTLNGILMSKRYVEGSLPNQKFAVEPTDDWNKINKFDKEHQVKTKTTVTEGRTTKEIEKQMALSDYLLANVSEMTKLAFKNGNITETDLKVAVELRDQKNQTYLDKKGKPIVDHPLAFIKVEGKNLVIPDNLTAQQRVDLMTLVYNSATSTKDFSDRPNKAGLAKVLLEEITRSYDKFEKAGKLDKKAGLVTGKYEANDVLLSLNIALRKGIEKNLEEQAYSHTKDYVRDNETPIQRLKNRLKIASGVDLSKVRHAGDMRAHTDVFQGEKGENKTIPSEVEIDLLMAQAFDILVPPDARFQMVKDQMTIDNTSDYRQKAAFKKDLAKNKQMWRMAILRHYNIGAAPGRPSIAEEINDQRIFSPNEADKIDHDYRLKIAKRIDELDRVNKKGGGFNELDISKANFIDSRELLAKALEGNQKLSGKVSESLTKMLLRSGDFIGTKLTAEMVNVLRKQIITETGLITGTNLEQDALVTRILENALSTQVSMEKKLIKMGKNNKASIKTENIKFGTNIQPAIKGVDLLYRRGVSEVVSEANRYDDLNAKGKPNYTMIEDSDRNLHISSTGKRPSGRSVDLSSSASMIQGDNKVSKENIKNTKKNKGVSAAPVAKNENKPAATEAEQKKIDEQAVELSKLLKLKDAVTNATEFRDVLMGDENIVTEINGHYEVNIDQLDLISADQLATLSHLSELINIPIQIDSLNLNIAQEGENTVVTPLNGFNITTLQVDVEGRAEFTTAGSEIINLNINNGNLTFNTDRRPSFINVSGENSFLRVKFDSQESLDDAVTKGANDVIVTIKDGADCVFEFNNEQFSKPDGIEEGSFILINEVPGEYKLVEESTYEFPEAEVAPQAEVAEATLEVVEAPVVTTPPPQPILEPTEPPPEKPPAPAKKRGSDRRKELEDKRAEASAIEASTAGESPQAEAPVKPESGTESNIPSIADVLTDIPTPNPEVESASAVEPTVSTDLDVPDFLKNRRKSEAFEKLEKNLASPPSKTEEESTKVEEVVEAPSAVEPTEDQTEQVPDWLQGLSRSEELKEATIPAPQAEESAPAPKSELQQAQEELAALIKKNGEDRRNWREIRERRRAQGLEKQIKSLEAAQSAEEEAPADQTTPAQPATTMGDGSDTSDRLFLDDPETSTAASTVDTPVSEEKPITAPTKTETPEKESKIKKIFNRINRFLNRNEKLTDDLEAENTGPDEATVTPSEPVAEPTAPNTEEQVFVDSSIGSDKYAERKKRMEELHQMSIIDLVQKAAEIPDFENQDRIDYISEAAHRYILPEIQKYLPKEYKKGDHISVDADLEYIAFHIVYLYRLQLAQAENPESVLKAIDQSRESFDNLAQDIRDRRINMSESFTFDNVINNLNEKFGINIRYEGEKVKEPAQEVIDTAPKQVEEQAKIIKNPEEAFAEAKAIVEKGVVEGQSLKQLVDSMVAMERVLAEGDLAVSGMPKNVLDDLSKLSEDQLQGQKNYILILTDYFQRRNFPEKLRKVLEETPAQESGPEQGDEVDVKPADDWLKGEETPTGEIIGDQITDFDAEPKNPRGDVPDWLQAMNEKPVQTPDPENTQPKKSTEAPVEEKKTSPLRRLRKTGGA